MHMRSSSRPLTPVEVATCGILSSLAVVMGVISAVIPIYGSLLKIAATVPLAMIAAQTRRRSITTAFFVVIVVATAIGGFTSGINIAKSALIGLVAGALYRHRVGYGRAAVIGVGLGVFFGACADAVLFVLPSLRVLIVESLRASTRGLLRVFDLWAPLHETGDQLRTLVDWAADHWWLWVPLGSLTAVPLALLVAYWLMSSVLRRITLAAGWDALCDPPANVGSSQAPSAREASPKNPGTASPHASPVETPSPDAASASSSPLPLRIDEATYTYPDASSPALHPCSLRIDAGEFIVIHGANGSGKSTLASLLAGAAPTSGQVHPSPRPFLGREGGIALIAQRSELLLLGDTVSDDVTWGFTADERAGCPVSELLERVGLAGEEHTLTRHLSGGQRQRLACASALARRPHLIISDESTAMVDPAGRDDLMKILASLPDEHTSVVHITHDPAERAYATREIILDGGRIIADRPLDVTSGNSTRAQDKAGENLAHATRNSASTPVLLSPTDSGNTLRLDDVTHTYDLGTPWEKTVLHEVSFALEPGAGLLITGHNCSGKTTLARIITGLMRPSWGQCTWGGEPTARQVGDIAYSMQFARLQLQRPTVREDICAAAGYGLVRGSKRHPIPRDLDREKVAFLEAMEEVGLSLDLTDRNVDQLSGGQMRRVALAGLLAANPQIMVLDEPTAGLDDVSRGLLTDALRRRQERGMSVLIISHDVEDVAQLCDERRILTQGVLS